MTSRSKDIILLLGSGASAEAGIPAFAGAHANAIAGLSLRQVRLTPWWLGSVALILLVIAAVGYVRIIPGPAATREAMAGVAPQRTPEVPIIESAGLLDSKREDADMYFLEQHYGIPTRLLDWSHSALAALFFAVVELAGEDGALYVMDGYQLATTQKAPKDVYQGVVTSRHPIFRTAIDRIFSWKDVHKFPEFVMAVRADQADTRMARQRSTFTFHVPGREALSEKENKTLQRFKIPAGCKAQIMSELSALGTDDFSIYNDMSSLARRLKRAHKIP